MQAATSDFTRKSTYGSLNHKDNRCITCCSRPARPHLHDGNEYRIPTQHPETRGDSFYHKVLLSNNGRKGICTCERARAGIGCSHVTIARWLKVNGLRVGPLRMPAVLVLEQSGEGELFEGEY